MKKICSLREIRMLPDGPAKIAMLANAELCHGGDEGLEARMEENFYVTLGGDWYLAEDGDDLSNFKLGEEQTIDLLSEEWRWCDVVTLENGYFMVFWATNNAGGPCLFIEDGPWIPTDFKAWLEAQIADVQLS